MSNVITLNVPSRRRGLGQRISGMIESFAHARRTGDDVFWLKENAELLNILECTGTAIDDDALAPHVGFLQQVASRIEFFPQYYRFLLSICLDLEDLGVNSDGQGERLVAWAANCGLPDAELSDLQRAEARRLMVRRGVDPMAGDVGLDDRLRAFIGRTQTFAMPNKKAAYELTHIVFYLSEYGRRDPQLDASAITSLEFAGLLAFLDQNADLLAEVCVALRYAGRTPSPIWENWLEREIALFTVTEDDHVSIADDYHEFFVGNWALAVAGRPAFGKAMGPGRIRFDRSEHSASPLRDISECMFRLASARRADWQSMRPHVADVLTREGHDILSEAEASSDKFDSFFAGFARTGMRGAQ